MVTAIKRPVRVTLEGEAYSPAHNVLMVVLPTGHKVCLTEGLGITVEDIDPLRVWTDGDVVQAVGSGAVWSRTTDDVGATWWEGFAVSMSDAAVDQQLASGAFRVLRYQAGESA